MKRYAIFVWQDMKKIYRQTVHLVNLSVVILVIFALTVSGSGAAKRLFNAYNDKSSVDRLVLTTAQIKPGPPAPEEAPENMANGSKPYCEQPAYYSSQFIVKSDNGENKYKTVSNEPIIKDYSPNRTDNSSIKTSLFLVSSGLGIQFTLVGAKPSGTS